MKDYINNLNTYCDNKRQSNSGVRKQMIDLNVPNSLILKLIDDILPKEIANIIYDYSVDIISCIKQHKDVSVPVNTLLIGANSISVDGSSVVPVLKKEQLLDESEIRCIVRIKLGIDFIFVFLSDSIVGTSTRLIKFNNLMIHIDNENMSLIHILLSRCDNCQSMYAKNIRTLLK